MSMNVSIGETLEEYVREKVTQGEYGSNSEVVREGLRLLKRREEKWKAEIAAKIEEGMAQLKAGKGIPGEEAWAELHARRAAVLKELEQKKSE